MLVAGSVGADNGDPRVVADRGHAHVAVGVDGHGVEQVVTGQAYEQFATVHTPLRPRAQHAGFHHVPRPEATHEGLGHVDPRAVR